MADQFFTVYEITNLKNGKTYVGMHKTRKLDDNYFGCGTIIRKAIAKHGIENFQRRYLAVYTGPDAEQKMTQAERILVVPDSEVSYNLCEGGRGGWAYVNSLSLPKATFTGRQHDNKTKQRIKQTMKMQCAQKDWKSGSFWVTDGASNTLLRPGAVIPPNFRRGRSGYRRVVCQI